MKLGGFCLKVNEFFNRFYLHDSLMENIFIEESKVTFYINLCWWMQKEYKPIDQEMKRIKVVFEHKSDLTFEGENKKVDSDTIFDFYIEEEKCNNEHSLIKIVFGDGNDIKVISFRSENVDLYWQ